ncbi:hypothetical protein VNO78_18256 [Psophocarpus tetragonolobus]|uniref:Uncharacterized protein n=1 Tax=Psophocarpus tetragonolobus TaxID=3891 RepID=A0AAN9SI39_PSOTE
MGNLVLFECATRTHKCWAATWIVMIGSDGGTLEASLNSISISCWPFEKERFPAPPCIVESRLKHILPISMSELLEKLPISS